MEKDNPADPGVAAVREGHEYIDNVARHEIGDVGHRFSNYLVGEGLLTRSERGPISDVDWPELLRRWSQDARYLDTSTTRGFLEPRGLDSLVEKLGKQTPTQRYAVSNSLATQTYASYAEARLGRLYTDDPPRLASDLGLRPVEAGANVILAAPRSPWSSSAPRPGEP